MEKLTALVESLMAAQNQPSTSATEAKAQTIVVSEVVDAPASLAQVNPLQRQIPKGFPWGMPYDFTLEGYQSMVQPMIQLVVSFPQPEMTNVQPMIQPMYLSLNL